MHIWSSVSSNAPRPGGMLDSGPVHQHNFASVCLHPAPLRCYMWNYIRRYLRVTCVLRRSRLAHPPLTDHSGCSALRYSAGLRCWKRSHSGLSVLFIKAAAKVSKESDIGKDKEGKERQKGGIWGVAPPGSPLARHRVVRTLHQSGAVNAAIIGSEIPSGAPRPSKLFFVNIFAQVHWHPLHCSTSVLSFCGCGETTVAGFWLAHRNLCSNCT